MRVIKLFFFFLFILKNSATGQIVTPSLDASVLSLMPASAGWRDETNFNASFESFTESDFEGNKSTASDVSYMVSSKLLYNLYQESFSSTTNINKKYSSLFSDLNEKSKNAKTKFNLAMGFGQPLAGNTHRFFVGVSYSAGRIDKDESTTTYTQECKKYTYYNYGGRQCTGGWTYDPVEGEPSEINIIETGFGLGVSYNVWQMLYVSYGVQQTTTTDGETSHKNEEEGSGISNYRYLGNTWLDKYYGFSIKNTKAGVAKFRLELSYIQSAGATNESSGNLDGAIEKTNEHYRYEVQIRNMEFSPTNLNNWIFFLHLKQNKIFETFTTGSGAFDDMTDEQISSGFYWSYPGQAGLSVGLRYIDSKRYLNTTDGTALSQKYQVSEGKGNRVSVDYRF